MPYTMKTPPDIIKNLPSGAKKVWIETFNSVVESKDEKIARQAAWSNVKKKYKKDGDKWVKKVAAGMELEVPDFELGEIDIQAKIPELDDILEPEESIDSKIRITASGVLHELIEEEGKPTKGIFRIIQSGWSGNGYYYTPEVTAQLVPFIEAKPMFFADHLEPNVKKDLIFGQKTQDSVAMAESVWADASGEVFAKLVSVDNPQTQWLWEAAQKFPNHIGLSIDAYGKAKKGEVDGKSGFLVEKFTGYDSTDFVYRPAAGGKFIALTEASKIKASEEDFDSLKEAAKTLADVIKRSQKKNLFWGIGYILTDFLFSIAIDYNMSDEDKEKEVTKALEDFIKQMKSMNVVKLFNSEIEEPNALNKLESKLEEPMDIKEMVEALKSFTPAQLLERSPDLYNAIIRESATNKEVQAALKQVPTLEKDNKELVENVAKLEKENEELKEAKEKSEAKLKEINDKEAKAKWENDVKEAIKASELPEAVVTEAFKELLMEQGDIEKVNKLIEDRKVVKPANFDNGQPTIEKKEGKKESVDLDQLARDISKIK